MERRKLISGVCAAVLSPRNADDTIDVGALQKLITFLISKGIRAFALNGATGEYCLSNPLILRTLLTEVRSVAGDGAQILCGIGAASEHGAISLARVAEDEGATGLLLPPPFFFPYSQDDVTLFCSRVARSTSLPVVLYNLPQFTTGISGESTLSLLRSHPNVIGIKDSSGSLENLRILTSSCPSAARIVGNDGVLAPAMSEGVCDAVISGVACAYPELISDLFRAGTEGRSHDLKRLDNQLQQVIAHLDVFPTPWGLKWLLQARNVIPAAFSQPLSEKRLAQGTELMSWFDEQIRSRTDRASSIEEFTDESVRA
jgi:4-hydroxy-tetrahydrodipicolinate synthase